MSENAENLTTKFKLFKEEETKPESSNLDIEFAQNLVKFGGHFFYCESKADCISQLEMLKTEKDWNYIHCWEVELKEALNTLNFQKDQLGYHLDNSNAALSTCEYLISDTGAILLAPKQASRRRLPMFPDAHILIADSSQLCSTLESAVEDFLDKKSNELPSLLDLSKTSGWKTSMCNVPVLYAEGPRDIYVFLCDEKLH
ncbi:MAG: LUD domain-containing protein [Chitinophagales bacterium]|nr:LUD domain-containing protein [Chitinophagales bacterium]